jgi:Ni,Fe-hydrogenase I large subunit
VARIVIDPVTRIGGHLRIEADVEGGVVTDAWSAATMFRGLELALPGRDPRDAWLLAERICGSDNGVHALASVRAVEHALRVAIPPNARLVRNLLAGSQLVTSHVSSFYQRQAPDWTNLLAATTADPADASNLARSISDAPRSSVDDLRSARERFAALVDSDQTGILATGGRGTGSGGGWASQLTPAADLLLAAHYLEALDWRRSMARLHTYLAGKSPHPQTFLVGGMSLTPPWGGPVRAIVGEHPRRPQAAAPMPFGKRGLVALGGLIAVAKAFVEQVYLPDVLYLAEVYRDQAAVGRGIGNYLAFGEFPEDDSDQPSLLLPPGRVMDHDLSAAYGVDQSGVAETVAHSHYADDGDGSRLRHPFDGRTEARYAGPAAPVTSIAGSTRYSWAKAPRYFDDPMETGPLARMSVAYARGGEAGRVVARIVADLGLGPEALFGALGRTVARAIEAKIVADRLDAWLGELIANLESGDLSFADLSAWDPGRWPHEAEGWSIGESPRGAVGHWVRIRDRRIADYQVVDGNTWNVSPRDGRGRRGAIEQALLGTRIADPGRPVELLRIVHSFDPCIACASH